MQPHSSCSYCLCSNKTDAKTGFLLLFISFLFMKIIYACNTNLTHKKSKFRDIWKKQERFISKLPFKRVLAQLEQIPQTADPKGF